MRVGYLQFAPNFGALSSNLALISEELKGTKDTLIVLPELALSGYLFKSRDELSKYALELENSPELQTLIEQCRSQNLYLVVGFAERYQDKLFNSAALLAPEGVIGCYRKIHLFDRELNYFDPGESSPSVYSVAGVKVGLMICFDWLFPEVARTLALQGAELICHPANLVLCHCQDAMQTRSIENGVFSITANRFGEEKRSFASLNFTGQSQIVGSRGELIHRGKAADKELFLTELDITKARDKFITPKNDILKSRRPEFYNFGE